MNNLTESESGLQYLNRTHDFQLDLLSYPWWNPTGAYFLRHPESFLPTAEQQIPMDQREGPSTSHASEGVESDSHPSKPEDSRLLERKRVNEIKEERSEITKRSRTIFTKEQLMQLEARFQRQQYMVGAERVRLAKFLDLSETQIKVWFQNRRIKWRRQMLVGLKKQPSAQNQD